MALSTRGYWDRTAYNCLSGKSAVCVETPDCFSSTRGLLGTLLPTSTVISTCSSASLLAFPSSPLASRLYFWARVLMVKIVISTSTLPPSLAGNRSSLEFIVYPTRYVYILATVVALFTTNDSDASLPTPLHPADKANVRSSLTRALGYFTYFMYSYAVFSTFISHEAQCHCPRCCFSVISTVDVHVCSNIDIY